MRIGLVVVDDQSVDVATLGSTLDHLARALRSRGFDPVLVVCGISAPSIELAGLHRVVHADGRRSALVEAARLLEGAREVVLVDGRLVLNEQLLDELLIGEEPRLIVDDQPPRVGAGLSVAIDGDVVHDIRWTRRYDRAAPAAREARWFRGVARITPQWTPELGGQLRRLVAGLGSDGERLVERDVVETIATVLVRVANDVKVSPLHGAVAVVVRDGAELEGASRRRDEMTPEALRLRRSVKLRDGFFTTYFVSPYSRYLARWAARSGWTPDQVTMVSLLVGVGAAAAYGWGTRAALIAGAVLLQVSFVLDCVDGQLARYTAKFSSFGAWLDATADRFKEAAVYLGLAFGASRVSGEDLWVLAALALALQTVRHHLDFAFNMRPTGPRSPRPELSVADLRREAPERGTERGAPTRLLRLAATLGRRPGLHWLKAIVILPIGERLALISIVSAVGGPRPTFVALIAWGVIAALYLTAGRVLRTWS